jgi:UDP-2,3-diacylglucosamine pyrophosphatase LpxH
MDVHERRKVDLVVISDVHLGTIGCHAMELLRYLKTISPRRLVLNGDIIDGWQFSKRYWPASHMLVLRHIIGLIAAGTEVYYLTGNHDEVMRKFSGFTLGSFMIDDKVIFNINGKKVWIFHGDVFDVTMQHSKWLARLGGKGYDYLILINRLVNFISEKMGKGKISLSKRVKNGVKSAVKFVNDFEQLAVDLAEEHGYDYVVCGHIHQPEIRGMKGSTEGREVVYLNSGDWVENLSCLEFHQNVWSIYRYAEDPVANSVQIRNHEERQLNNKVIFNHLVNELKLKRA